MWLEGDSDEATSLLARLELLLCLEYLGLKILAGEEPGASLPLVTTFLCEEVVGEDEESLLAPGEEEEEEEDGESADSISAIPVDVVVGNGLMIVGITVVGDGIATELKKVFKSTTSSSSAFDCSRCALPGDLMVE